MSDNFIAPPNTQLSNSYLSHAFNQFISTQTPTAAFDGIFLAAPTGQCTSVMYYGGNVNYNVNNSAAMPTVNGQSFNSYIKS